MAKDSRLPYRTEKKLPFRANGHRYHVDDGTLVDVRIDTIGGESFASAPALDHSHCGSCDAWPRLQLDGDSVTAASPCPHPDGITSVTTLDVPSGKVIVSDDLRPVYDWDDGGLASLNSALGQAQASQAMAEAGCAYGAASNVALGLYDTGGDTYVIATVYEDDDEPLVPQDRLRARICTDLWAYSLADYEDWKSRGGDPAQLDWTSTVVDVTPGTYEFTHHAGERGFDAHDGAGNKVFAHVKRITRPARARQAPGAPGAARRRSRLPALPRRQGRSAGTAAGLPPSARNCPALAAVKARGRAGAAPVNNRLTYD